MRTSRIKLMQNQLMQYTMGWPVQSDQELIDRFQQGDERAFEALVRRQEQRIRTLCSHYLTDPQDVQDASQEIFIRVYHALPVYRPEARFSTWLIRIAINQSLNVLRSRRRRAWMKPFSLFIGEELHQASHHTSQTSPLDEVVQEERRRIVKAALDALPEKQRTAVILHRFQGLKYIEIAEATGSSVAAVEARLHRARLRLASLLTDLLDE